MAGWQGSTRRSRLPPNWPKLVAQTKRRAGGRCQHTGPEGRCPEPGTDCDHIRPGDDHRPTNLQWLCGPHHMAKTIAERDARKRRPVPPHPGLT